MRKEIYNQEEGWASKVLNAIQEDRIHVAVQGIHLAADTDCILYGECLARLVTDKNDVVNAGEFIPSLELLRKTPVLDQHMIRLILDELEADQRAVLGCNISTDSLANKSSWNLIYNQLVARSHLAHRLILEIIETHAFGNVFTANEFLSSARQLGCLIAIDDFGRGQVTPWQLLKIKVDIIKIDGGFVREIKENISGGNSLHFLIGFAKCVAPTVVVEGVETRTHHIDAMMAGATHTQGYYLSRPTLLNPMKSNYRENYDTTRGV
jgi:EAL domain-containing protein (putative c-di-GMP-specific phosphodiesterase class I)